MLQPIKLISVKSCMLVTLHSYYSSRFSTCHHAKQRANVCHLRNTCSNPPTKPPRRTLLMHYFRQNTLNRHVCNHSRHAVGALFTVPTHLYFVFGGQCMRYAVLPYNHNRSTSLKAPKTSDGCVIPCTDSLIILFWWA